MPHSTTIFSGPIQPTTLQKIFYIFRKIVIVFLIVLPIPKKVNTKWCGLMEYRVFPQFYSMDISILYKITYSVVVIHQNFNVIVKITIRNKYVPSTSPISLFYYINRHTLSQFLNELIFMLLVENFGLLMLHILPRIYYELVYNTIPSDIANNLLFSELKHPGIQELRNRKP